MRWQFGRPLSGARRWALNTTSAFSLFQLNFVAGSGLRCVPPCTLVVTYDLIHVLKFTIICQDLPGFAFKDAWSTWPIPRMRDDTSHLLREANLR